MHSMNEYEAHDFSDLVIMIIFVFVSTFFFLNSHLPVILHVYECIIAEMKILFHFHIVIVSLSEWNLRISSEVNDI